MAKIGIAIIGTGAIAGIHIDAYGQFAEDCEIRVLCDFFIDKAQKMKKLKNLDRADVVADWRDILEREDVDAVSLCLPPGEHAAAAIRMLQAGKHVLVEKPMALSLEDCDKMIAAAEENRAVLGVVSQNRYKIPVMKVKKLLEEKAAGRVLLSSVNSYWWRGENYYDLRWRGRWADEGGGCMMSHAVHHVDLLQWMVGMPDKVTAVMANNGHGNSECEDVAIAILQYPGMTAQITASLLSHDEEQEMIFQTERARLSIPWKPAASKALGNGFPTEDAEALRDIQSRYESLPELELEGHPAQIRNFLDAVGGTGPMLVDGKEGRKAVELIMAVYKSAVTGTTVSLPISREDAFYRRENFLEAMPHFHEKTFDKEKSDAEAITLGRDVGK